jgi:hypothetical protein
MPMGNTNLERDKTKKLDVFSDGKRVEVGSITVHPYRRIQLLN